MSAAGQGKLIAAEARRWIGTPYQHQASLRGRGSDCLGLVRGVWRAFYGEEAEPVPPYAPGWAEEGEGESLLLAARRHLIEIDPFTPLPGDVLLFRPRLDGPARHCAVLSRPGWIIHAYWGRAVTETALTRWWMRRQAACFRFPEIKI
ncbi:NlpC/P60 family protein [Maricaulis sp.]|uniref:NlpC/P60 family protein n=1 Tax=Maricaulis sp. TaxID=1486257 RepID=UPI002638F2A7|nr:NlpC/P60 family protein [Maricaulis sp.]